MDAIAEHLRARGLLRVGEPRRICFVVDGVRFIMRPARPIDGVWLLETPLPSTPLGARLLLERAADVDATIVPITDGYIVRIAIPSTIAGDALERAATQLAATARRITRQPPTVTQLFEAYSV